MPGRLTKTGPIAQKVQTIGCVQRAGSVSRKTPYGLLNYDCPAEGFAQAPDP